MLYYRLVKAESVCIFIMFYNRRVKRIYREKKGLRARRTIGFQNVLRAAVHGVSAVVKRRAGEKIRKASVRVTWCI